MLPTALHNHMATEPFHVKTYYLLECDVKMIFEPKKLYDNEVTPCVYNLCTLYFDLTFSYEIIFYYDNHMLVVPLVLIIEPLRLNPDSYKKFSRRGIKYFLIKVIP